MSHLCVYHSLPSAGLIRRLAALVYDSLLVMAIAMAYSALMLLIQVQLLGQTVAEGEKAHWGAVGFTGLAVTIMCFFCFFWRRGGQTLGMRAWRLKIVGITQEQPSVVSCLLRCLLAPLSLGLAGAGYLWCLIDKGNSTLHDRLSGSRVVVIPKEKKK